MCISIHIKMLNEALPLAIPSTVEFTSFEPGGDINDVLQWDGNNWVSTAGGGGDVSSITGTSNQVIASSSTGAITLSLPQSIGTASTVQFGTVTTDDVTINNVMNNILRTNALGVVSSVIIGSGLDYVPGTGTLSASGGNVSGGGISSDNAITRWDGATGTTIQNSTITLSDTGVFSNLDSADKVNTINGVYQNSNRIVWTNSDNNLAVGQNTLTTLSDGTNNTAIGRDALSLCTTGANNTAIGYHALKNMVGGTSNVAIGMDALLTVEDGSNNVAIGDGALKILTDGTNNTAIGHRAGDSSILTGANNILIGYNAQLSADHSNCIVIGSGGAPSVADGSLVIGQTHIRNLSSSYALYYNPGDSEVTYDLTSIPMTNKIIHVMKTGNDETAAVYNIAKPYLTLEAASTAASDGDLIVVYPGSYTTTGGLAKNGVNWYFHQNTIVSLDPLGLSTIFNVDFASGGNVYGYAEFFNYDVSNKYLCDKNSDINITIECNICFGLTTRILIESPNTELRFIAHQYLNGVDYMVAESVDIACNWHIESPDITCASLNPTIFVRGSSTTIKFIRLNNTGGTYAYDNGNDGSIDNIYGKYCSYIKVGKNSTIDVNTVDQLLLVEGNVIFNGRCGILTAVSGRFQGGIANVINSTSTGIGILLTVKTTLGNTVTDCNIGSSIDDGTGFYDFELYSEIGDDLLKSIAIAQGSSGRTNVKLLGEWSNKQYIFTVSSGTLEVAGHYISNTTLLDSPFILNGTGKLLLTGRIDMKMPIPAFPAIEAINGTTFISNKGVIVSTDLSCIPIRTVDGSSNYKVLAGGFSTNYTASDLSTATLIRARYDITSPFEGTSILVMNTSISANASSQEVMAMELIDGINSNGLGVTATQDNPGVDTYFYVTADNAGVPYDADSFVNLTETYIISQNSYPLTNITGGVVIQSADVE